MKPWQAVSLLLLVLGCYRGLGLMLGPPDPPPNLVKSDLAAYVTTLLQSENPAYFGRDPLWQSGLRRDLFQTYSAGYMVGLRAAYDLAGQDIWRAMMLYSWALQSLYLAGAFGLAYRWSRRVGPSALIALLSLIPSGFVGTGTVWGIPNLGTGSLPFHLQTALGIWVIWGCYEALSSKPGGGWWQVGLLGLVAGALAARVNVITGVAMGQWVLGLLLLLVWQRTIAWPSLGSFGMGFGLAFAVLYLPLGPQQPNNPHPLTWPAAQAIIADPIAGPFMVFPWLFDLAGPSGLAGRQAQVIIFMLVYGIFSLLLLWGYRQTQQPTLLQALLSLQYLYLLLFMRAGGLPILLGVVALWQVGRGRWSQREGFLLAATVLALHMGFTQQLILYYLWRSFEWAQGTALLFELARFAHFAYLPFYGLLLGALLELHDSLEGPFGQMLLWLGGGAFIAANLGDLVRQGSDSDGLIASLVLLILGAGVLWLVRRGFLAQRQQMAGLGMAFALSLIVAWSIPSPSNPTPSLSRDYVAMTAWIADSTPVDSLVHLSNLDPAFRYHAQRSLLVGEYEWLYGMYTQLDPLALQAVDQTVRTYANQPTVLLPFLQAQGVDYWAVGPESAPPDDPSAELVYRNEEWAVYALR